MKLHLKQTLLVCTLILLFASAERANTALAEVFTPRSDSEVLEQLPQGLRGTARQAAVSTERQLKLGLIDDQALALYLKSQLANSRSEADPRYASTALAMLSKARSADKLTVELLLLRATLSQFLHNFSDALSDLEQVRKRDPHNAQSWISSAAILLVQGEFLSSQHACRNTIGRVSDLVLVACLAGPLSMTEDPQPIYQRLSQTVAASQQSPAQELTWAFGLLGEIAERTGRNEEASLHYQRGLQVLPGDNFLRTSLADLQLRTGRTEDVWEALSKLESEIDNNDGLLIRLAIAAKQLGKTAELDRLKALLVERSSLLEERRETGHQREQALIALQLEELPAKAHRYALANWALSKEMLDTLLLIQTSIAEKDENSLTVVREWLKKQGTSDKRVAQLN